ncbi:MAG: glycosyltransferase [Desulfovibrionaceae bacterium]
MRICTVHSYVAEAFRTLGHEVLALAPPGGAPFDIAAALDAHGFAPDLLFQQEPLGPRTLLTGLDKVPGIRIFWAIDTHLNRVWHRCYAQLFDGLATPHRARLAPHAAEFPPMRPLPIPGRVLPWTPHADRPRGIGFVGRITEYRMPRNWLMEHLRDRHGAEVADGLTVDGMFAFYGQTRLAPNEAICDEANFRLLEAASAGCLVLSHDAGPDQDDLLAPGAEILVYRHVLELRELLDWYTAHPEQAERLARRAWERIAREHTLRHRALAVLDFAASLSRRAVSATDAAVAMALSQSHMRRKGMVDTPLDAVRAGLEACPALPATLAERLRLDAENGNGDAAMQLAAIILDRALFPDDVDLNLAGSMAALHLGQWEAARRFWQRQTLAAPRRDTLPPETPHALHMAWAAILRRAGRLIMQGAIADPATQLPQTALDCLHAATLSDAADLEPIRQAAALLGPVPGTAWMRMGHLARLAMHHPGDWRTGLDLGLANLKANRLDAGLEECRTALAAARSSGREDAFIRALSGRDPGGLVLQALGR